MPGYGVEEGTESLLDWATAVRRLRDSRRYWVATAWPDGRPHIMPVWAAWLDDALWFSSSVRSRKARNLRNDPRCALTTDDAEHPVVMEGVAELVTDLDRIGAFLAASNAKYQVEYGIDFLDPAINATFRVAPVWAFALDEEHFTRSPTRWRFDP